MPLRLSAGSAEFVIDPDSAETVSMKRRKTVAGLGTAGSMRAFNLIVGEESMVEPDSTTVVGAETSLHDPVAGWFDVSDCVDGTAAS